jgi:YVTN family beta-propeller protein
MIFSISGRGLAALGVVLGLMLALAVSAGAAPLLLTGNVGTKSVSTVNTQTGKVVGAPITVGETPESIAVTPNGQFAYVVNRESNSVSVIDLTTRKVVGKPITVGIEPVMVAISPDGQSAYVADVFGEDISVISTQTNQVVGSIPLGTMPHAVAFAPSGAYAYVSLVNEEKVVVIDTATRKVVGAPIAVGKTPTSIAFTPNGRTAYVADLQGAEISAINTETHHVVSIQLTAGPYTLAVNPAGTRIFATEYADEGVSVVSTETNQVVKEIDVGEKPAQIAITPSGETAYVSREGAENVTAINTRTYAVAPPLAVSGEPVGLAITPDQSPTAIFSPPDVTAGLPATFEGAASTDPDGTIASWDWVFGDGDTATGVDPTHTYTKAGTYNAELSVVDDEGCGVEAVFTGRTAYCSGNPLAKVVHPVEAKVPLTVCSAAKFRLGGLFHNRKNGTARLQVKLPAPGSIFLFGKKVHAVTRKSKTAGAMLLTIHARVELNKQLKKIHRANVRVRVTYTPSATCGTPRTLHTSISLLRAPRKKHSRS